MMGRGLRICRFCAQAVLISYVKYVQRGGRGSKKFLWTEVMVLMDNLLCNGTAWDVCSEDGQT